MDLAILGSGNVAYSLTPAFHKAGHKIVGVWSRNEANASRLALQVEAEPCKKIADIPNAEVYIICVTDDSIASVAEILGKLSPSAIILHTAGSLPMDILKNTGCNYGVMYPMQTFSREKRIDMIDVPIFFEGNNSDTLEKIRNLAASISKRVKYMDSEKRARLHLAAVFACNFTNHCFTLANQELKKCGENFSTILPLVEETIAKVRCMTPQAAQTGPAVRGDEKVLKKQEMLIDDELTRAIFQTMSKSIRKHNNDKL